MTSWLALVHETDQLTKSPNLANWQIWTRAIISGIFWTISRTGAKFQVLFNLETCSSYSVTNYVKIPVCHFLEKVNKGHVKMEVSTIKNGQILLECHFNKIINLIGPQTSFQSPAVSQKNTLQMFVRQHTSIWPNFILVVLRIEKK